MGAETSPCPTATPNPWEMLSCGEGTLHSTQTVRPSCLDGNGTMWDELLPAFHWLGFFLCNTLSQPPSAKAQQEAWLSAPGYLLSLFVQEMGNSYPHNSVSSRAAHTQVREKEGTSRHWQEHTLEAFLTFSSSWSQKCTRTHPAPAEGAALFLFLLDFEEPPEGPSRSTVYYVRQLPWRDLQRVNRISPADPRLCSPFSCLHFADFSYPSPSQLDAVLIFPFTTVMLQDCPGRMNTNSSYRLHSELMELKQDIVSRESVRLNTNKGCFSINTNEKLSHCACSIKALPTKQWCLLLSCKFSCSFQAP